MYFCTQSKSVSILKLCIEKAKMHCMYLGISVLISISIHLGRYRLAQMVERSLREFSILHFSGEGLTFDSAPGFFQMQFIAIYLTSNLWKKGRSQNLPNIGKMTNASNRLSESIGSPKNLSMTSLEVDLWCHITYYATLLPTLQPTETIPAYKLNLQRSTKCWL